MASTESNTETQSETVIRGTVRRVTYHNPLNGYVVLQLTSSGDGELVTVVGTFPQAHTGAQIMARGSFTSHPKYGKQLTAMSITEALPSSADGLENYLASGLIKGIGSGTARRLVQAYGEKVIDMICQKPDEVAKVAGVGKKKAEILKNFLSGQRGLQGVMRFLMEHNITQGLAQRIYERYETRAVEVLTHDPYLLAREMRGVGFITADAIAMNLGHKPDSPQRLKAGLYYALEKATEDGHCFLPLDKLFPRVHLLLKFTDDHTQLLTNELDELIQEGYIVAQHDDIYLKHLYRAEDFVAKFIADRLAPRQSPDLSPEAVAQSLEQGEKELGLIYSPEQRHAVHCATMNKILIVTGGPGCGKTTIIRALSLMYKNAHKRLRLAAPTGRAAQRMSQVCGMDASTIHRLLKYDPRNRGFTFGVNEPLPIDALIIDEASMIDMQLARDLFSAIPSEATLILVGDKDQLPSVGPGRVFGELIALHHVPTISLSQLFRRAQESHITGAAHLINRGVMPDIPQPDGVVKSDAYFIARETPEEAAELIEKLVADQIPKKFGFSQDEIAVLTPSNRGELGAERLNERLQAKLNPPKVLEIDQELTLNHHTFRLGDKICQRVNNYNIDEAGVYNGDTGKIFQVNKRQKELIVELWDSRLIKYSERDCSQLSLAYSITVHRSQGSEIPCVVLALHDYHYALLDRQLIYTAVTRAKRLLIVVGSKRALSIAVKRANARNRYSNLTKRIQKYLEEK